MKRDGGLGAHERIGGVRAACESPGARGPWKIAEFGERERELLGDRRFRARRFIEGREHARGFLGRLRGAQRAGEQHAELERVALAAQRFARRAHGVGGAPLGERERGGEAACPRVVGRERRMAIAEHARADEVLLGDRR
ncbi:MAG: hypothetical protein ACO3IB_13950, partial [Phycisphaerales bacterium]